MSPKNGINSVIWAIINFRAFFPKPLAIPFTPPPFFNKDQGPIVNPPIKSGKKEMAIPTPKKLKMKRINPVESKSIAIKSIIILSNSIPSISTPYNS